MKTKNKIIIVLVLLLLVRLFLIIHFKTYAHPKLWEYEEIANNLIAGKGFLYHHFGGVPYRSFNNPLYSFMSAGIYLITNHSYLAILLVQTLFSILLVYVIFCIGRLVFNDKIGLFSSILVAFHPSLIYYDVFNLIPFSIDLFFIALITLLFLRYKENTNNLKMLLAGAFIGLGVLSRGIIGAILPFFILYIVIFFNNYIWRKKIKLILFLTIGAIFVISPWVIRNYIIHKKFILVSAVGETLWRGNNKYSTGTSFSKDGKPIFFLWPEEFRKKVYSLDEIGQSKFFAKEAGRFIKNNPSDFINLYFKKMFYFWWFSPQSGILYPKDYLFIYKVMYTILLAFSLLGIYLIFISKEKLKKENSLLIITVFAAICFSQSLFYVEGRHRWLIEPLLIIFFTYGISECYTILVKKINPKIIK